jgi:hypothetical protein
MIVKCPVDNCGREGRFKAHNLIVCDNCYIDLINGRSIGVRGATLSVQQVNLVLGADMPPKAELDSMWDRFWVELKTRKRPRRAAGGKSQ